MFGSNNFGIFHKYCEEKLANFLWPVTLPDTRAEVEFWESVDRTWREVLCKPWVLTPEEVLRIKEELEKASMRREDRARQKKELRKRLQEKKARHEARKQQKATKLSEKDKNMTVIPEQVKGKKQNALVEGGLETPATNADVAWMTGPAVEGAWERVKLNCARKLKASIKTEIQP